MKEAGKQHRPQGGRGAPKRLEGCCLPSSFLCVGGAAFPPLLLLGGAAFLPLPLWAVLLSHPPSFAWGWFLPPDFVCDVFSRISCSNFEKATTKTQARSGPKSGRGVNLVFKGSALLGSECSWMTLLSRSDPSCGLVVFFPLSLWVGLLLPPPSCFSVCKGIKTDEDNNF